MRQPPGTAPSYRRACDGEMATTSLQPRRPRREPHRYPMMSDGRRRIDYVLAYESSAGRHDSAAQHAANTRNSFESALVHEGLQLERVPATLESTSSTVYVKVHAPFEILGQQAEIMRIRMPIQRDFDYDSADGPVIQKSRTVDDTVARTRLLEPELSVDNDECACSVADSVLTNVSMDVPHYYTAPFCWARRTRFLIHDEETFFSPAQRSLLVKDIMDRIRTDQRDGLYDTHPVPVFGVDPLLESGAYTAAYPLHEGFLPLLQGGRYVTKRLKQGTQPLTERHVLYMNWARWVNFFSMQPLDLIRRYFGDKIGIYFTFLGYYTQSLFPPAILGVCCVFYGFISIWWNEDVATICTDTRLSNTTMCPICSMGGCGLWRLGDACKSVRMARVFDNGLTSVFALAMSIWATVFMERWARYRYELQFKWDLQKDENAERVRPAYAASVAALDEENVYKARNPVTGELTPYLPQRVKKLRTTLSFAGFVFFVLLFVAFVFGMVLYWIVLLAVLSSNDSLRNSASLITTISAAVITLIVMEIMRRFYRWLSRILTDFELPRTQKDYEKGYTWKIFLFQFVNYYSTAFYIAFFKGRIAALPGEDRELGSYRFMGTFNWESCNAAGCIFDLQIHLLVILVGQKLIDNIVEIVIPTLERVLNESHAVQRMRDWCGRRWRSFVSTVRCKCLTRRPRSPEAVPLRHTPLAAQGIKKWIHIDWASFERRPQWETDYNLSSEAGYNPLHFEYLEIVMDYGFITLFAAAFPLGPLVALINSALEIRMDAAKYTVVYRRPPPERAVDLGVWNEILQTISRLAVLTNALVVAFTSDVVPKLVYYVGYSGSYDTYMDFALSYYNTSQLEVPGLNVTGHKVCRFVGFRRAPCGLDGPLPEARSWDCDHDSSYRYSLVWWHVFAARLLFALLFEHMIMLVMAAVRWCIPEKATTTKLRRRRRNYVVQRAIKKWTDDERRAPAHRNSPYL